MNIILQSPSTAETAAVRTAVMLMDAGAATVRNALIEALDGHVDLLRAGALPVGSVEFVRRAMELAGIPEPQNLSYPPGCHEFLGRSVERRTSGEVLAAGAEVFVKPVATKLFNGFVLRPQADAADVDEHDREQLKILWQLPLTTLVYASPVVEFQSEWRYYVQGGEVIGRARYDADGPEDAKEPDEGVLRRCIEALAIGHPHALDMGVLVDGSTILVEANDGWGLGLYRGAMKPAAYLNFLAQRWESLYIPKPRKAPAP